MLAKEVTIAFCSARIFLTTDHKAHYMAEPKQTRFNFDRQLRAARSLHESPLTFKESLQI